MWPNESKKFCELFELKYPIIQAPIAGGTTPELIAAVSNAGGLGSLAAGYMPPGKIREAIHAIRRLTKHNFAVNLFIPPQKIDLEINAVKIQHMQEHLAPYREKFHLKEITDFSVMPKFEDQLAVLLDENINIFSFTFGVPDKNFIKKLKTKSICLMGTATNVEEAKAIEACGCAFVIAQGSEAGGHRGSFSRSNFPGLIGTMALVPAIKDAVSIPVIAAGGIMDGRSITAALQLGACAVQMGTAFLACPESGFSDSYKTAILNTKDNATVISKAFSGKPARLIINPLLTALEAVIKDVPEYPLQHFLTSEIRQAAAKQNLSDYQALFAGQGVGKTRNLPAELLIKTLVKEVSNELVQTCELPHWLKWASELQAIAQNGLAFSKDVFDQERFAAIRSLSAEMIAKHAEVEPKKILNLFMAETGYATPKVDVRCAVIKDDKILMVRERSDNLWTLPGGWADINESPSEAAVRETYEESGFEVKTIKLVALYDKHKHEHPPHLYHTYKCYFLCELLGGEPKINNEISEIGFFSKDNLPELSLPRVTQKQILRCFEHYDNLSLPTDFD